MFTVTGTHHVFRCAATDAEMAPRSIIKEVDDLTLPPRKRHAASFSTTSSSINAIELPHLHDLPIFYRAEDNFVTPTRSISSEAKAPELTRQYGHQTDKPWRVRKRLALPLIMEATKGAVRIVAYPDTGSDDNIISLELAKQLGLVLDLGQDSKMFSLANGKQVEALGKCSLNYQFGAGDSIDETLYTCTVYVFKSLIVPALMGAEFLMATETFTKYRNRLTQEFVPATQFLQVNSVGKAKQALICRLNTFVGCANADTGSDLDLISPEFAKQRSLLIHDDAVRVEFADGSTALTSGFVDTTFSIGSVQDLKGFIPTGDTLELPFFVLEGLTSDILVGQGTLEELGVMDKQNDVFINCPPTFGLSDCAIIRYIGKAEGIIGRIRDTVRTLAWRRAGLTIPTRLAC